ncbi:MAG TPA: hypothetical protein DD979_04815 [Gammaproteobacteria bacterium]|nr:hypothetical protein [Gammaproteobacteria bacterium]
MGVEKPFAGRARVSLEYLDRVERMGTPGFNRKEVNEQRGSLGLSYSPSRRMALSVVVPWVDKQVTTTSLAEESTQAVGDINLTAKLFLQPDTPLPKHLYGVTLGVTLPTAPEKKDASGQLLDIDAQPGAGATIAQAGAWYSHFQFPYLFYISGVANLPSEGDQGFHPGDSFLTTLQVQYSFNYQWAVQANLDTRWSERDTYDGERDANSGGFLAFIAPGMVFKPVEDLLLTVSTQIPVIDDLHGEHEEGQTVRLGVIYDW